MTGPEVGWLVLCGAWAGLAWLFGGGEAVGFLLAAGLAPTLMRWILAP